MDDPEKVIYLFICHHLYDVNDHGLHLLWTMLQNLNRARMWIAITQSSWFWLTWTLAQIILQSLSIEFMYSPWLCLILCVIKCTSKSECRLKKLVNISYLTGWENFAALTDVCIPWLLSCIAVFLESAWCLRQNALLWFTRLFVLPDPFSSPATPPSLLHLGKLKGKPHPQALLNCLPSTWPAHCPNSHR